jgi:hypothetical protein
MQIFLPKLHRAQIQIKNERRRHNVINCGRRFGKNILLQDLAVEGALHNRRPVGWGAPVYKQMMDDFRSLDNILAPAIVARSKTEMRLELLGGGSIEFHSLDKPDNIRGKRYARFVVNEAAFVPDLLEVRNFVITPTLIDFTGDDYYSGTPKGMNGFYNLYNQTGDDWQKWHMTSYSNPHIPKSELDGLRATMHERAFAQEIMAEFIEDGAGVFRNIHKCATGKVQPPQAGHQYVIGVDWGRTDDATVFSVVDIASRTQVYIDRMTDTDFASQRMRLKVLSDRYNHAVCLVETNSIGQPQLEALQVMDMPVQGFQTTNATKQEIISALQLALEQESIILLDDVVQTSELMAYSSERLPSGLLRFSSPEGMHDDTVMALALAWWSGNTSWLISSYE